VNEFRRRLVADGPTGKSVSNIIGMLHKVMSDATEEGFISSNPVRRIRSGRAAREVGAELMDAGCAVVRGVFDHTVLEQLRDELQPHVELADPEAGRAMNALYEAEPNGLGYRDFYPGNTRR